MKQIITIAICMAIIFCIAGCKENKQPVADNNLKIGYVDADIVLDQWDKAKIFTEQYTAERTAILKEIAKNKKVSDQDKQRIFKFDQKWSSEKIKLTNEINAAATKVAESEHLHVMLNNSSSNPYIEYGGEDFTIAVLTELKKNSK